MQKFGTLYVDEGTGDPTDPASVGGSDDDLREVFESLLEVRRLANTGAELTDTAAILALTKASCLVRELGNWAGIRSGLVCTPAEYERLSPRQRRDLITGALRFQLQILQPQARVELAKALAALDVGETAPLLEKERTGRRRASPARTAQAEHGILRWIRWQYGRGRKLADVEAEVAGAVYCTPTLFPKWRAELVKIYGKEVIGNSLAAAEKLGRFEAGQEKCPVAETKMQEFSRRLQTELLETDLAVLVALRREGMSKRRTPG
jgi:hypothetical protein